VGRLKKEILETSDEELNRQLMEDFEIPSPSELGEGKHYEGNADLWKR